MRQTHAQHNRPQLQDVGIALLSVAALVVSTVFLRRLTLGVTLSVGILSVYSLVRRGDIRTALVSLGLWAVFATAVSTSSLLVVFPTGIGCVVSYIAWTTYGSS
jgi:hypothetical protein